MKHFLFAADFSKANANAFQYAKQLIHGHDIKLDIINVYDAPLAYASETGIRALHGLIAELEASALKRMNNLMEQLPEQNRGKAHPIYGIYPSVEIHECAEEIDADMIIMSLREDYGIMKRLFGSTTARTIHKSSRPVMAIPAHASYKSITNILFPTIMSVNKDLSIREEEAINWLSVLSGFLKLPEIELLHIIDDEKRDDIDITIMGQPFKDLRLTFSHAYTIEEGILEYMQRKKPDILAFYKPHRNFWERLYMPSKTRNLLYDSNIPLIVFG